MTRSTAVALLGTALGLAAGPGACSDHEFEPPDRAERVAQADSAFSPTLFDTVSWSSRSERIQAGNLVYADHCRRCHGPLGQGDTEYGRTQAIEVPSLVRPDWPDGDDIEVVRRRVFTGHVSGMPSLGIAKITPRQIDAASYYVVEQLRQEVTDTTRLPGGS